MNREILQPKGLRKWVRAHVPNWEYFLFDVPFNRRNVTWMVILLLLALGIIFLPVDFIAKWLRR